MAEPLLPTIKQVSKKVSFAISKLIEEMREDQKLDKEEAIKIISINVRYNPDCVIIERNGRYYWLCS